MARNPDAQAAAQAEIDSVIGPNRLAAYADRVTLPYVTALIRETFRWQPVTPFCTQHCLLPEG
jgi:cytochrome P450